MQLTYAGGFPVAAGLSESPVTAAFFSLIGLVASALIAGYFGTRHPAPPDDDVDDDVDEVRVLRARVAVLERSIYRRGHDPARVVTGEEPDASTRITP